jgi:hypothetical protein
MRRAIILAAVLAAGAVRAFDASPLLQYVTAGSAWTPASLSPVAWYRFDGNALDSASTNNGTWTGSPVYTTGVIGQGAKFAASERVNTTAKIPLSGDFTICAWINIQAHATSYLLNQTDGIGAARFLFVNLATGELRVQLGATTRETGVVATNQFTHLMLRRNSWTNAVYANATLVGTEFVNTNELPNVTFEIGGTDRAASRNSLSIIDDVLIFNRALTQSEITQLYNWRQ